MLCWGRFLLVVAAFSLVWQPTRQRLETVERQYQQQLALAAQLQQAQPRATSRLSAQPLVAARQRKRYGSGARMHQMDTDSDQLRLTLSGDAKALLQWLDRIERDGAVLQSLTLEKRDARAGGAGGFR